MNIEDLHVNRFYQERISGRVCFIRYVRKQADERSIIGIRNIDEGYKIVTYTDSSFLSGWDPVYQDGDVHLQATPLGAELWQNGNYIAMCDPELGLPYEKEAAELWKRRFNYIPKEELSFSRYQKLAERTAAKWTPGSVIKDDKIFELEHCAKGLNTEAGEFDDALKKHIFYDKELDETNLKEELGDILWYIGTVCERMGWSMEDVAKTNIEKLRARYPEKFSQEKAENRDLDREREVLENG